jgi:hypothetical protein
MWIRLARHAACLAAVGLAEEAAQPTRRVALHRDDGMGDEHRVEALVHQLGKGGVEQERHVVVDRLDDGDLASMAVAVDIEIGEAQIEAACLPRRGEMFPGRDGDASQRLGRVGLEVLLGAAAEQHAGEIGRDLVIALGDGAFRAGDKRLLSLGERHGGLLALAISSCVEFEVRQNRAPSELQIQKAH